MSGIYTGISLMGCDKLKSPIYFFLCIIYEFERNKSENPIILLEGWNTIMRNDHDD